jgi:hypothetical protein
MHTILVVEQLSMSDVFVMFPNRLANVIEVNYLLGNACFMKIEDANRRFVKVTQDPIPVYEKASKAKQQSRIGSGQSKRFSPAENSLYSSRIVDDTLFGKLRFFRIVDVSLYTSISAGHVLTPAHRPGWGFIIYRPWLFHH